MAVKQLIAKFQNSLSHMLDLGASTAKCAVATGLAVTGLEHLASSEQSTVVSARL